MMFLKLVAFSSVTCLTLQQKKSLGSILANSARYQRSILFLTRRQKGPKDLHTSFTRIQNLQQCNYLSQVFSAFQDDWNHLLTEKETLPPGIEELVKEEFVTRKLNKLKNFVEHEQRCPTVVI